MSFTEKREAILTGNLYKVILTLSGPIILNNLIQTFYNLTDTFFVSKLGSTEIAAIQFVWPLIFMIIALGIGLSMASSSMISQHIGAKQYKEASKVSGQLIYFSLIFSIVVGITGFILSPYIIRAMGGTGELFTHANNYLRIMFLGTFSNFLLLSFIAIKQGQGDTKTPMKFSILSVITNIILDPIFIFTFGLGVSGAAIATVISRTIFALLGIYYLVTMDFGLKIDFNNFKFNSSVIKKITTIGLPTSFGQATTAIGFAVLNVFIISYGEGVLAAFAIGNRIASLVFLPAMGIGSAVSIIVGQNLGADKIDRARDTFYKSLFITITIMTTAGLSLLYFSDNLIEIFTKDPFIISEGTYYLKFILLTLPLMGVYQLLIGVFIGSGHTIQGMIVMVGRLWLIRIPLMLIFKTYSNLGTSSIWYSMVISNILICIIGYGMFLTGKWKTKIIKDLSI